MLAQIETDNAGATKLPVSVIRSARRKLTILRAVTYGRALKNWKSLQYELSHDGREDQRSIRLSDNYRIVFKLDNETEPQKAIILAIEGDS